MSATDAPRDGAYSPIVTSRSMLCSLRRACRSFFAPWRLTDSLIGTALFTGNPALGPLLTRIQDCDLIIVRIDPVNRPEAPRNARDILNRTIEISHNSTFWLEIGAIAVVLRFADEGRSPFRRLRFHIIEASPIMEKFPMSSKLNNYPPFLEYLFNLGRQTGDAWIAQNGEALGQRSTMDLQHVLPGSVWDNI